MSSTTVHSSKKRKRHRIHGNPFSVPQPEGILPLRALFSRPAPLAIDIGFGAGQFLVELARQKSEMNILGIEIRPHFVEKILEIAEDEGLPNLSAVLANVNRDIEALIPDDSVAFVSVNFPDPWFKKRHQKRRVINQEFLDIMFRKFRMGGQLHLMTDFEPIGQEALELLSVHPGYQSPFSGFLKQSSTTIRSEREITHVGRGDPIYRLFYEKVRGGANC
ncbi:MAG: tRNA (guanosine(46)-N7)-methyltransferase TrmB [Myxococcota bacterium]|nr:tRNA (guanosine(46)-N7)-methyltransferase TrmB [Myxococcota bacterium]